MTADSDPRPAYTIANWTVRPDAEDAFVEEWTQFSLWLLQHRGAESFTLIKASGAARHFVSVAQWSGRGSTVPCATFLERLGKCRALCEKSESRTYRPVVSLNGPCGAGVGLIWLPDPRSERGRSPACDGSTPCRGPLPRVASANGPRIANLDS